MASVATKAAATAATPTQKVFAIATEKAWLIAATS
jgi:hypothetical protein